MHIDSFQMDTVGAEIHQAPEEELEVAEMAEVEQVMQASLWEVVPGKSLAGNGPGDGTLILKSVSILTMWSV